MNLPNKLTILRIALIPVFVIFMMIQAPLYQFLAMVVFGIASLTDLFDGYYARKHDMVTDFGKFMDPIADKLLVMAALVGLVAFGRVHFLAVMILLGREFIVSGMRLVIASKGVVLAADTLGKWKTVAQMIALVLILANGFLAWAWVNTIGQILLWISVVLSVLSCIQYIWNNREVLTK